MWIRIDRVGEDAIVALRKLNEIELADALENAANRADDELAEVFRSAARKKFGVEGDLEFDDDAVISKGDASGAYVMAWKWVENGDAGFESELSEPLNRT